MKSRFWLIQIAYLVGVTIGYFGTLHTTRGIIIWALSLVALFILGWRSYGFDTDERRAGYWKSATALLQDMLHLSAKTIRAQSERRELLIRGSVEHLRTLGLTNAAVQLETYFNAHRGNMT